MAVHLSTVLILTGLAGICCLTTVSEVSVKAGDSVTIPCLYDRAYINHVKYLCEGYYWSSCSYAVKTNQPDRSGKFSISDDKNQRIFTVTVKRLTNSDTDYWCVVEINGGSDIAHYFHLSITSTPSLYVDHQEVTGIIGENITISCHYRNTGIMGWCRLGKNCVTGSPGSIDGTRVTMDAQSSKVFTVTMSELKAESSGWYWCAIGNFQMPVHVTVTGNHFRRNCCLTTVSEVSVKAGDSVTIPCLYDRAYINHVKYLCEGYYWSSCSYAVKTNQSDRSGKFSISDDKNQRIFTVTVKRLTNSDTDYWCVVEINGGSDIAHYFHLSITSTPSLYVDHQEVTGIIGENITINCHYRNSGIMKWCRLGKNCVTGSSGSIDGTRVTIDARSSKVFTVTMSELKAESSGWYWCAIGNFQMPVHVTVTEKPTTTTNSYSTDIGTITTVTNGQNSVGLKSLIIRLSVLVFIVIVSLIVWFMLRYKQTKAESSSRTMVDEGITFSTVKHNNELSSQTQEDAIYSEAECFRENSPQRSNAESDVEVM